MRDAKDYAEPVSWAQKRDGQWKERHTCTPTADSKSLAFVTRKASANPDSNVKLMVLCGSFSDTTENLVDLSELRDNSYTPGATGRVSNDPDDYSSRPGSFLHELCHWVGGDGCRDPFHV
jgi:hypothetical protein